MSQKLNAAIAVIGIDIGKNSFHIVGRRDHHAFRGARTRTRVPGRFGLNRYGPPAAPPSEPTALKIFARQS
jgi:hypothetical protein